ncbi:MAG: ATP-binding protein [Candidatus Eremiobacteraeota bacterium]|nr:ATP-binding protein [Candidatus Eremiobacteraeota bacterium]
MPRRVESGLQEIALENINDAVLAIDKNGKIVLLNRIAAELFKVTQEEAIGKKVWDVVRFSEFNKILMTQVKDSNAKTREQMILFPHNQLFQMKIFPARTLEDKLLGAIAILRDLSELSRIEKAVNQYVATISHELKTPLTSIKGYVETLLEEAYYTNPEISRKFLQIINDETNRMTRLIVSMLELATMGADKKKPHLKPMAISPLINDAVRVLTPIAQQKNITFEIQVPEDLPRVIADEDKIKQVFINVIDNAIKYTGILKKGTVKVEARDENKSLRINIIDTGIGIPEEHQGKIFERFYRVKDGPSSELGGTGLGLSITKEIVEECNGTIHVESQPGKGSKFTIILPLANSPAL